LATWHIYRAAVPPALVDEATACVRRRAADELARVRRHAAGGRVVWPPSLTTTLTGSLVRPWHRVL
jgi:hypothetical protein